MDTVQIGIPTPSVIEALPEVIIESIEEPEPEVKTELVVESLQAPARIEYPLPKLLKSPRKSYKSKQDIELLGTPVPQEIINADLPVHLMRKGPRAHIANWLEIKAIDPDVSNIEAASKMGISRGHLSALITRATREGWLVFEDPLSKIEFEIIPKVVKNLNKFLDAGDKTVTIETAKGTIFKLYQDSKSVSEAPQTMLAIKIEPVASDNIKVITGHIVGKPRVRSNET